MTNPNATAFPVQTKNYSSAGLTKREYFAVRALQGLLANGELTVYENCGADGLSPDPKLASQAVKFADLLIDALNKKPD